MGKLIAINFDQNKSKDNNIRDQNDSLAVNYDLANLIQSTKPVCKAKLAKEHTAEPIKDKKIIQKITQDLLSEKRYRDYMLFVLGINFGLRVSDLLEIKFSDIIDENLRFKDSFDVLEKKTENTRKVQRNRKITINEAVRESVTFFLSNNESTEMNDYLFQSQSNRGKSTGNPLSRKSVDRILKDIGTRYNLGIQMSTHTLRKTFGYHIITDSNNDPRMLYILQKIYGHSSINQTLDYIGLTNDEISKVYTKLNLGIQNSNDIDAYSTLNLGI